jgi:hypothetical protein
MRSQVDLVIFVLRGFQEFLLAIFEVQYTEGRHPHPLIPPEHGVAFGPPEPGSDPNKEGRSYHCRKGESFPEEVL